MRDPGRIGVLVINFGEPDEPTHEKVVAFLERIFLQTSGLEPGEAAHERARTLALDRAPGLIDDYASIGGSPLNRQALAQSRALETVLRARGYDAVTYAGFQFTEPSIADCVQRARADGVDTLIALPVYPICGRTTTVAALEGVQRALDAEGWAPDYAAISGWHHHPSYRAIRVDNIARTAEELGVDCREEDTLLYFSVHGTPIKFLDEGNRYDRYVEEHCRTIAETLDAERYCVGFQNHTNRRVVWTQPDNEDAIRERSERRLLVVPIAFMHEQSETLAELDGDLHDFAIGLGKEFHRVPVPHDDPRFVDVLADIVEELTPYSSRGGSEPVGPAEPRCLPVVRAGGLGLARCRCAPGPGVYCANADRCLPPSAYVPPRANA